MKLWGITLRPAGRKWNRTFSQAVARSLSKTVTEPVTNSYDSYKMIGRLPRNSGIVDALLGLKEGNRVTHDSLVQSLPRRSKVPIGISVATVDTNSNVRKRECRVFDQAAGMDSEELKRSLEEYGQDKSGQSSGKPVRGLFGQGLSDVLFGHDQGTIVSFKDNQIRKVTTTRDENQQPHAELVIERIAAQRDRRSWGVLEDGTCVSVLLNKSCPIPDVDSIYERLCNFYMLRLINADPACEVILENHRSSGTKKIPLSYNFPPGAVVGRFGTDFKFHDYATIRIEGIAIRADEPLKQETSAGKEGREGGFLIIDEADTVYDLTLFDYEKKPGLERLYGLIRLEGAREIIKDLLDNHDEAVVTESREGFDVRTDFTKALWKAIQPVIKPIIESEAALRTEKIEVSEEAKRRIQRAFHELNKLFTDETEEKGDSATDSPILQDIQFEPSGSVTLIAGIPRDIRLIVDTEVVNPGTEIIIDCTTSDITILPNRINIPTAKSRGKRRSFSLRLLSNVIGARGMVEAIAERRDGEIISAKLKIRNVMPPPTLLPPEDGIEFRPALASAAPHRTGCTFLFVDIGIIPLGSEIHIRMEDGPSGLGLLTGDEGAVAALAPIKLASEHLINGERIAKIAVRFRGQAKGQERTVVAKAKGSDNRMHKTSAQVRVREPESPGAGMFSKPDYRHLGQQIISTFDDGIIWLNWSHPINRAILGEDKASFCKAIDESPAAQIWLADVVLQEAMYHIISTKYFMTGEHGFQMDEHDPIGSIRRQMEQWKFTKGLEVFRALVPGFSVA